MLKKYINFAACAANGRDFVINVNYNQQKVCELVIENENFKSSSDYIIADILLKTFHEK